MYVFVFFFLWCMSMFNNCMHFFLLNVKCGCNYKEKGREKKTKTKQKQINIKKNQYYFEMTI